MEKQESIKDRLFQNNNSSLNNSKSKAMYTFPKDDRFPALVAEGVSQFYDKKSMLNKRAPSFGYGNKSDIANKSNSPSPDKYKMDSDFQASPKKGLTLAQGRQECKSISIFNLTHNPGPGNYNLQNDKDNIKALTMSSKFKFPSLWVSSIAPGPGAYQVQKIDQNGSCITSKYKTKNSFKISPQKPLKQNVFEHLGPTTYNTNLPSTGKQLLAKNKSQKVVIFGRQVRETLKDWTISPGPGAYSTYSNFG